MFLLSNTMEMYLVHTTGNPNILVPSPILKIAKSEGPNHLSFLHWPQLLTLVGSFNFFALNGRCELYRDLEQIPSTRMQS